MTFEEVAERLRKHGIPAELTLYEAGYEISMHSSQRIFETLDEAARYLDVMAKRLYPDTYGKEEK